MDELEISGKRYISTRRAAKQYKYHSDYIGQLIRGKKILGTKVGRSWYVELESLAAYFGKETGEVLPASLVAKAVVEDVESKVEKAQDGFLSVQEEVGVVISSFDNDVQKTENSVEEKFEIISEEKKDTSPSIIVEEGVQIKEPVRDSIHIPVRLQRPSFESMTTKKATTLVYVSDDEPYIPTVSQLPDALSTVTNVIPRKSETDEEKFEQFKTRKSVGVLLPIFSVGIIGILVLAVVLGGSVLVSSHVVIEAGKAASVGYTLH